MDFRRINEYKCVCVASVLFRMDAGCSLIRNGSGLSSRAQSDIRKTEILVGIFFSLPLYLSHFDFL